MQASKCSCVSVCVRVWPLTPVACSLSPTSCVRSSVLPGCCSPAPQKAFPGFALLCCLSFMSPSLFGPRVSSHPTSSDCLSFLFLLCVTCNLFHVVWFLNCVWFLKIHCFLTNRLFPTPHPQPSTPTPCMVKLCCDINKAQSLTRSGALRSGPCSRLQLPKHLRDGASSSPH